MDPLPRPGDVLSRALHRLLGRRPQAGDGRPSAATDGRTTSGLDALPAELATATPAMVSHGSVQVDSDWHLVLLARRWLEGGITTPEVRRLAAVAHLGEHHLPILMDAALESLGHAPMPSYSVAARRARLRWVQGAVGGAVSPYEAAEILMDMADGMEEYGDEELTRVERLWDTLDDLMLIDDGEEVSRETSDAWFTEAVRTLQPPAAYRSWRRAHPPPVLD